MRRYNLILMILLALAGTCTTACNAKRDTTKASDESPSSAPSWVLRANGKPTKAGKPLAQMTQDDLKAALEKAGYEVTSVGESSAKGTWEAFGAFAKKANMKVHLEVYHAKDPVWRKDLAAAGDKENMARLEDGEYFARVNVILPAQTTPAKAVEVLKEVLGN